MPMHSTVAASLPNSTTSPARGMPSGRWPRITPACRSIDVPSAAGASRARFNSRPTAALALTDGLRHGSIRHPRQSRDVPLEREEPMQYLVRALALAVGLLTLIASTA